MLFYYGAIVNRDFIWGDICPRAPNNSNIFLDLQYAEIDGTLIVYSNSWPSQNNLLLNGLIYNEIKLPDGSYSDKTQQKYQIDVDTLKKWMDLQYPNFFFSQPYERLAMILKKHGYDEYAKKIIIKKRHAWIEYQKGVVEKFLYTGALYVAICVYFPFKLLAIASLIILFGFGLYFGENCMIKTKASSVTPGEYPKFRPFIYSLDAFIPLIDLKQVSYRLPKGGIIYGFFLFETILGWIIMTLTLAILSGIVKI